MMEDGEVGLMPDIGAHDGLCGSHWARAQAEACIKAGVPVNRHKMEQPRKVKGVGRGSQSAEYEVELTTGLVDTNGNFHKVVYHAP